MLENQLHNPDAFAVATLIYARLRRVSGRVIDAIYLVENLDYVRHVIQLAEQTKDPELGRLVERLKLVLNLSVALQPPHLAPENPVQDDALISVEPNEDDIYRAQISHHYIGALR